MATQEDKFRKLLGAYEDEVQRKQHKMGKRIDPRTDEAQPNPNTGYVSFLRGGQQVVWSPSFDVIGTFEPDNGMRWTWGWADQTLDGKVRTRVDGVRKQAIEWKIECLTSGLLTLESEQEAWELSMVATAVARADAMYRYLDGTRVRFLALFDSPPPSRSSMMMRAQGRSDSSVKTPAAQVVRQTPYPALGRVPTGQVSSNPALSRQGTSPPISSPSGVPPANPVSTQSSLPPRSPSTAPSSTEEREPTAQTRLELGQRMLEAVPFPQQAQLGLLNLLARAQPPIGPVGAVSLDLRLTMKAAGADADTVMQSTAALHDALAALWLRCRDRAGGGYRFATVRVERTPQGMNTQVFLEW